MTEPRTLDARLVVHVWVEAHDELLRGRIVGGPGAPAAARGVDAISALVRQALERLQSELAEDPRDPG